MGGDEFLYGSDDSFLFQTNLEEKTTGFNPIVKEYFDALIDGRSISNELKTSFHEEVLKLSKTVGELYKVSDKDYKGETPVFDEYTLPSKE